MTDKLSEDRIEAWNNSIPLKRPGETQDVANLYFISGIRFVKLHNKMSHQCRWRSINLIKIINGKITKTWSPNFSWWTYLIYLSSKNIC